MKKRLISSILSLIIVAGTFFTGCGSTGTTNVTSGSANEQQSTMTESDENKESEPIDTSVETTAAEYKPVADRPGAKWIDSGIYGTYEGMGDISLKDDFAAAINRDWAENVKIREGAENVSARTEQTDNINEAKLAVLTGEKKDDQDLTSLQNYYALLTDWDTRNKEGLDPLKPYVEDLMSISSVEEMTKYYSDPGRNLYGTPMVSVSIIPEPLDPFVNMLCIQNVSLLSDEPDDYQEGAQETAGLAIKHKTAEYMLKRLGYSESEANDIFDTAKGFERKFLPGIEAIMADISGDPTSTLTIAEFEEKYKKLPFADIFRSLGYDVDFKGKIMVGYTKIVDSFDENYSDENIEGIKAWTLVNTLLDFTKYCDFETYEETAKLNGSKTINDADSYALKVMEDTVPSMVDQMYVNYCFDKSIKPQVEELTDMMVKAYRKMLMEEDWLSDETKAIAIEKLDNIKLHICYPEKVYDVKCDAIGAATEGETALSAIIKGRRYFRLSEAAPLSWKNDGTYWRYDTYYSTLGAIYMPQDNSMNILAGICGGDYYDESWPLEKKLGGLCMIVGHELTHAFDTTGANFDKDGAQTIWWTDEDGKAFQERVDKLLKYYSELAPMPQVSDATYGEEGAQLIQGEAISDLGSLKCLLSIAKEQEDFDYDTFFKQIAIIQKQARYEEAEKEYVNTNDHPVEAYRANVPLQNYDDFLNFYNIKEGDGMYLAPEDRITVW